LWAEQQLVNTRLAVEAQTEIDEAAQRRRVAEALGGPIAVAAQRDQQSEDLEEEDMYLPIAAEAEAASLAAVAELPAAAEGRPARTEPDDTGARSPALIPTVPDIARTAARWLRPLVPPVVARAIDTTVAPMRTARQVLGQTFEEVEEVTFTLKRTHRVNAQSVSSSRTSPQAAPVASSTGRAEQPADQPTHVHAQRQHLDRLAALTSDQPAELCEPEGPRALPPG
ncbi:MAG TPA: DUF4407 domain-containing protein, partial [Mycobacterium sp.]|nr:DUF4407 domain-containing protein [Mycobacterium sp.]